MFFTKSYWSRPTCSLCRSTTSFSFVSNQTDWPPDPLLNKTSMLVGFCPRSIGLRHVALDRRYVLPESEISSSPNVVLQLLDFLLRREPIHVMFPRPHSVTPSLGSRVSPQEHSSDLARQNFSGAGIAGLYPLSNSSSCVSIHCDIVCVDLRDTPCGRCLRGSACLRHTTTVDHDLRAQRALVRLHQIVGPVNRCDRLPPFSSTCASLLNPIASFRCADLAGRAATSRKSSTTLSSDLVSKSKSSTSSECISRVSVIPSHTGISTCCLASGTKNFSVHVNTLRHQSDSSQRRR